MRLIRFLLCFALLGILETVSGCGWGGNPQDFVVSATPSGVSLQAGASGQAVNVSIRKLLYFNSPATVTLLPPSGITCDVPACAWTIQAGGTQAVTLSASSTMATGSYSVPLHAVSGTISHDASVTVIVQPATGGIQPAPPNPAPPAPTPDFTFSLAPSSLAVTAGASTSPLSVQIARINGDVASITITAVLPSGLTCTTSPCAAAVTGDTVANAFTLAADATLAPGTYSVAFIATDGANSHTVTVPVSVAAQPVTTAPPGSATPPTVPSGCRATPYQGDTPNSPGGMRFAYTGAAGMVSNWEGLNHLVYDPGHNVVFETNANLNEVDVISPNTMTLLHRIPVPEPVDLDLSADGKTLYVSSLTPYFYRVDTSLFCVRSKETIAVNQFPGVPNAIPEYAIPIKVLELADGSVGVLLTTNGSGYGRFAVWMPGGVQLIPSYQNIGYMVRSGNRQHVYFAGADSGGWMGRYDVSTGTLMGKTVAFGSFPAVLAVNQDGSKLLGGADCCQTTLLDSNFNTIAAAKLPFFENALASPDFSHLYLQLNHENRVLVADGTSLAPQGYLPGLTQYGQQDTLLGGFDGTGHILAAVEMGLGSIPVGPLVPNLPATDIRLGGPPYNSGLIPISPVNGSATTLNGAGFTSGASVLFNGSAATGVTWVNSNVLNLTVPHLDADCVDVEALFPNGSAATQPLGYCYRPRILYLAGDAGPAQGGGVLTLYGLGLGDLFSKTTRVLVGGVDAGVGQVNGAGGSPYSLEMETLQVTVPPGAVGTADIQVILPGGAGSTLLPQAYTYVDRTETALSSNASPVEMVFDSKRARLLISDKANSQVLVYSTSGKQMLPAIPTGQSPRGLALTPDGTKLLIVTAGDRKITVLDADSYGVLQQAGVPSAVNPVFTPVPLGDPQWVLPLTGGKALVLVEPAYLTGYTFTYDLQTNQLAPTTALAPSSQNALVGSVSDDGTVATVDNYIYDAVHGTAQRVSLYGLGATAIAPDNSRFVSATKILDVTGLERNALNAFDLLTGIAASIFDTGVGRVSPGGGSLYYEPTNNGIRIWDMQHGTLRQNVSLPGSEKLTYSAMTKLMAVDPNGGRAWTVNAHGLVDVEFASDPLSIGSATATAGQLTVQGSGFSSTMEVSIDGQSVASTVTRSTSFKAALPSLSSGNHAIQITDGSRAYTLDMAFATP